MTEQVEKLVKLTKSTNNTAVEIAKKRLKELGFDENGTPLSGDAPAAAAPAADKGADEKKKEKKPRSEKQIAALKRMAANPSAKQIAARAKFKANAGAHSAKANAAKASGTTGKRGRPAGKKVTAAAVKKTANVKKIDYDTASPTMKKSIDRCRALLKAVKQKRATAKKYRDGRKKEGKPAEMQVAEVLDAAASKVELKIDKQIRKGRFTTKTQAKEISTDIKHIIEYVLKSMEKQADKKQFVDDLCAALKKAVK